MLAGNGRAAVQHSVAEPKELRILQGRSPEPQFTVSPPALRGAKVLKKVLTVRVVSRECTILWALPFSAI